MKQFAVQPYGVKLVGNKAKLRLFKRKYLTDPGYRSLVDIRLDHLLNLFGGKLCEVNVQKLLNWNKDRFSNQDGVDI